MSKSYSGNCDISPEERGRLMNTPGAIIPVNKMTDIIERGDETKFDNGKVMWDLLPYEAIEKVAEILTYGYNKYCKEGWKSVPDAENRYFAALMRHLIAEKNGEEYDDESGYLHLSHVATNALFLLWFKLQNESSNIEVNE